MDEIDHSNLISRLPPCVSRLFVYQSIVFGDQSIETILLSFLGFLLYLLAHMLLS